MINEELLTAILEKYWSSTEFNAYSLDARDKENFEELKKLISGGNVIVKFENEFLNPHIRAFDENLSPEEQIKKIEEIRKKCPTEDEKKKKEEEGKKFREAFSKGDFQTFFENISSYENTNCCVYPSKKYLELLESPEKWKNKPHTLEMAKGDFFFSWRSFELPYLQYFRDDPTFSLHDDFVSGRINGEIEDEYFEMRYGLAFDEKTHERYWGMFLGDLARLPQSIQGKLKVHEIKSEGIPHPEFFKAQMGNWSSRTCLLEAIIKEQSIVCEMSKNINGQSMYKIDYDKYEQRNQIPISYHYLTRPTQKCFEDFSLALAQMLIDNLDKHYFDNEPIPKTDDKERQKGTLQLLEDYLNLRIKNCNDPNAIKDIVGCFREIQSKRSRDVHRTKENTINEDFIEQQNTLLKKAYSAMNGLRQLFSFHYKNKNMEVPDYLNFKNIYI
jgi:hypothetical protein